MFDTLIKNGRLVDGSKIEVAIEKGMIKAVAAEINQPAQEVVDLEGKYYLSAGWIDDHVHCYEKMNLYYDYPDQIGVEKGVTTVIDAGTTGAENIREFYQLTKSVKTNVYALMNISKWGIVKQDELADLTKIQEDLVSTALAELPEFIVGIKARMSKTVVGENGIKPLELAKKIQTENNDLPLMVHIGSAPPELEEVLSRMERGDVLTHCFNGKPNGILDPKTDQIKNFVWDAYNNGVVFDIGHGTDSFNFHVAETALKAGMKATSISTDIYIRNRTNGPVFDLATTLEKLRVVGYSWEEIIEKVTAVPARNFHLKNKGQLAVNYDADLTIFEIVENEKELKDSNGFTRIAKEQILPIKTIIGGEHFFEMSDLAIKTGAYLSQLLKVEDAQIVSSASAGIAQSVAALIGQGDMYHVYHPYTEKIARREIIIPKGHNVDYGTPVEVMVAQGGGKVIEAGYANMCTPEHVSMMITEKTAALLYIKSHHAVQKSMLTVAEMVEVAKAHRLPLIVDAAAEEDLFKYSEMGVDLVIYSGAKAIEGPSAGLVIGKNKYIQWIRLQSKGIGRAMKIGKDNILGFTQALEDYLKNGSESGDSMKQRLAPFVNAINQLPDLSAKIVQDGAGRDIYRASVTINGDKSAKEVIQELKARNPAVYTREYQANNGIIEFDIRSVSQNEMEKIIKRLREIM
ncbi:dihydroorotase [Enterococcus faecium]|uniref:amidohydrolase/deacetylase family metallohydrolase n=5 Tax=Enterococcus TaxID=1350 RepID=UPI000DEB8140|nr:amidohydrolase/deacetylase family metallohydrolase [Enterococcus faecium]RBS27391.1 dihydroorotase [Enterococcus faecium]